MNPGPVEEGGKVATSIIDSLKTSPMILALVVFNVLYMIINAYTAIKVGERAERVLDKILNYCEEKHSGDTK